MQPSERDRERYIGAATIVAIAYGMQIVAFLIPPHDNTTWLGFLGLLLLILIVASKPSPLYRAVAIVGALIPIFLGLFFKT